MMESSKTSKGARSENALVSAICDLEHDGADMFSLGYDVALRILCHLPVKSLFMLKCVSRQWLAAIFDPSLAKLKSATFSSGLLKLNPSQFVAKHIATKPDWLSENATGIDKAMSTVTVNGKRVLILDCHKGLLLCCELDSFNKAAKCYYVCCTLTSSHYVSLPIPSEVICKVIYARLICDEDQHIKIIQISEKIHSSLILHTFYRKEGKWRVSKMPFPWSISRHEGFHPTLLGKTLFRADHRRGLVCAYHIVT